MAQKWNELALGYSGAIVSAVGMFLMGIFGYTGFYRGMVNVMLQSHMYFAVSPLGMLAGMIEAAIWGFIAGYAIAWIYNKFA